MKVFILQETYVNEETEDTNIFVFSTLEKAKEKMKELKSGFELENDLPLMESSDASVCYYDDGWYTDEHYNIDITEKEVM